MRDRRYYDRSSPCTPSPAHRGQLVRGYSPRRHSHDSRVREYSPAAVYRGRRYEYDDYCRHPPSGLSPPSEYRRYDSSSREYSPVNAGRVRPIERSEDRGRYCGWGPYSPPPRQHAKVEEDMRGVAEDSQDGWRVGYRNRRSDSNDELNKILDVDNTGRVRLIERSDGHGGRYSHKRPNSPPPWQHAEEDMQGVAEDVQDSWRCGYRTGRSDSYGESRRVVDINKRSHGRDSYRDGDNMVMARTNEYSGSGYGESASGMSDLDHMFRERGGNVDARWRVDLHVSRSPGNCYGHTNSYGMSDGRSYRSKDVLNDDVRAHTSVHMDSSESLRNFPGFLGTHVTEAEKPRLTDYGPVDPSDKFCWGKPSLEGRTSRRGLSAEGELPSTVSVSQMNMYSPPSTLVDVNRALVPMGTNSFDSRYGSGNFNPEASGELPPVRSSTESEFLAKEVSYHRQNHAGPVEDVSGLQKHSVEQGTEKNGIWVMPDKSFLRVRERYGLQNPPISDFTSALVDGISGIDPHQEDLAESRGLDHRDYGISSSYKRVEERQLVFRNSRSEYDKETDMHSTHLHLENGDGYEGYGSFSYRDSSYDAPLTQHDQVLHKDECIFHENHTSREMDAVGEYDERRDKRRRYGNDELGRCELRDEFYEAQPDNEKIPAALYRDKDWTVEDNSLGSQFQHRMVERMHEIETNERIDAKDNSSSSQHLPVHMRLDFRTHWDIKRRLGPPPKITRTSFPWIKKKFWRNTKNPKSQTKERDSFLEVADSTNHDDGRYDNVEPSEDSEEFKQLVNNHFLRFFKFLNETSAQHRRYTDQGGSGTLKCSVCGSASKDFGEVRALVMHAFMSQAVGLRSEHLGYHKALCVLMGLDSTYLPDKPWVARRLSPAEASDLRDGLIIWPPIVVIHNSSLTSPTSQETLLVSIEDLEAILKGWGFSYGIRKLTCGKPANNSILHVIYNATLSGLLEAERLGKFFAENGHGKVEFEKTASGSSSGGCDSGDHRTGARAENAATVLYGYLGIAEDLENLDSDTKKRSVIRSKKELEHIADAPLG